MENTDNILLTNAAKNVLEGIYNHSNDSVEIDEGIARLLAKNKLIRNPNLHFSDDQRVGTLGEYLPTGTYKDYEITVLGEIYVEQVIEKRESVRTARSEAAFARKVSIISLVISVAAIISSIVLHFIPAP